MTRTDLTAAQAAQILIEAVASHGCGIRGLAHDVDEMDEVVYWTASIFDPHLPEGQDEIGSAQFPEHWPEVNITWAAFKEE